MPNIPDRWLQYKPIGERIEATRFICFKVPLEEEVNTNVEPEQRLDSKLLLTKVPDLGLVIDLTYTAKYYNPEHNFKNKGIEYYKIYIPGHDIPKQKYCKEFDDIVTRFLEKNRDNDKLIGVHCTHGVNRTGFVVCHHMVTVMNIQPEDALKRFERARGHPIERPQYLSHISNLNEDAKQSSNSSDSHIRKLNEEAKHSSNSSDSRRCKLGDGSKNSRTAHSVRKSSALRHHPHERRISDRVKSSTNVNSNSVDTRMNFRRNRSARDLVQSKYSWRNPNYDLRSPPRKRETRRCSNDHKTKNN